VVNKLRYFYKYLFLCLGLFVFNLTLLHAQQTEAQDSIVIQNARIIIGDGTIIESGSLHFENGEIIQVSVTELQPLGALVLDAAGKTIIPALIDGHSHLGYQGREDWGSHNYGPENLIDNLEQYAYYGFSAVFSAGSDAPGAVEAVEASRQSGEFFGARLLYAAGMAPPGEGPNNQFLTHALAVEETFGETILYGLETPNQARKQVQAAATKGISFIKIWVDDRGGSQSKLEPEIYRAVIDEANNLGLKVFVHQQFASDMPGLLNAGAHGFLHGRIGSGFDIEVANQVGLSGAFVVPNWGLAELRQEAIGEDRFLNDIFDVEAMKGLTTENSQRLLNVQRLESVESELRESFSFLLQAGVDIVLGTDAGAVPDHPFGYTGHRELEIYVRLGMTPMQAIIAATSSAAKHLGLEDYGQLKPGFSADVVILNQNPLEDIRNTRAIEKVFLRGEEIDRAALRRKWQP